MEVLCSHYIDIFWSKINKIFSEVTTLLSLLPDWELADRKGNTAAHTQLFRPIVNAECGEVSYSNSCHSHRKSCYSPVSPRFSFPFQFGLLIPAVS